MTAKAKKKQEVKITYKAKAGAPFPKEKAEEVGKTLEKIQKKNNGKLSTKAVLSEARNPKSELHPYFDWRDDSAAEKWRLHQARLLINHVEVVYIKDDIEETYPQYINIHNTNEENPEEPERAYVDHVTVGNSEFMRQQALKEALKQLIHWKQRYKWLNELNTIVQEIVKLESKFDM